MSFNKLYIIGNGFDLQHGLKSKYWDFKEFLEIKEPELLEKLERYFDSNTLWSDFEETLAYLDTEQIINECLNYLESYSVEDWSDAYHHDYQYEVQRRIDIITKTLKERFTEWILQLQFPDKEEINRVHIDKNALFINFNYTDTLEQLYKIQPNNIFFIHNKAIDIKSNLILGHGRNPKNETTLKELYNDENSDVRVVEGNRILDDYFIDTYKSTEKIINENKNFFDSLAYLKNINIYGHSMSLVDKPYYQEIVKRIDLETVFWKVSFHNKNDLMVFDEFFTSLKVPKKNVSYDRINNIDSTQLSLS